MLIMPGNRLLRLCQQLLFAFIAFGFGCGIRSPSAEKNEGTEQRPSEPQRGLSKEAASWLKIACDPSQDRKTRADAVAELGQLGETAAVPHLIRLLPGEYDLITLEVVIALGRIGDPSAIPALEQLEKQAAKDHVELDGKTNAQLEYSLRLLCGERRRLKRSE